MQLIARLARLGCCLALVVTHAACGGQTAPPDVQSNLRDTRYCEVLLANVNLPNVHVTVYNTIGLNDCPDAAWSLLDANTLATEHAASFASLNGPRYWMIDAFVRAAIPDPTVVTFGSIDMRAAAAIDLTLAEAMQQAPYQPRQIQRDTTVRFVANRPVYELVDPAGRIFDMQSYSVQTTAQTAADLATLGDRLVLPTDWTFRTRVLTADLVVTAIDQVATVVQDDLGNTYQLSQQQQP